jgi:hypothetical protein
VNDSNQSDTQTVYLCTSETGERFEFEGMRRKSLTRISIQIKMAPQSESHFSQQGRSTVSRSMSHKQAASSEQINWPKPLHMSVPSICTVDPFKALWVFKDGGNSI